MMRPFTLFFTVIALSFVLVPTAWGQYRSGQLSISLLLGGHVTDMSGLFGSGGALETRGYDVVPRESGILSVEYTFLPWIGIEAFIGKAGFLQPNNFDMPIMKNYTFDYWYIMSHAILHINPSRTVVPYITGGLGGIFIVPGEGGVNTQLGIQLGAGLDVFVSEQWVVRVDIRFLNYAFRATDFDPITLETSGLDPTFDERLWNMFVVAGIRYAFK